MTSGPATGSAWTSPTVIVAALAIISNAGWAYVELSRVDGREIQQRLNTLERDVAVIKSRIEQMDRRP